MNKGIRDGLKFPIFSTNTDYVTHSQRVTISALINNVSISFCLLFFVGELKTKRQKNGNKNCNKALFSRVRKRMVYLSIGTRSENGEDVSKKNRKRIRILSKCYREKNSCPKTYQRILEFLTKSAQIVKHFLHLVSRIHLLSYYSELCGV